jgi:hypothetical protein
MSIPEAAVAVEPAVAQAAARPFTGLLSFLNQGVPEDLRLFHFACIGLMVAGAILSRIDHVHGRILAVASLVLYALFQYLVKGLRNLEAEEAQERLAQQNPGPTLTSIDAALVTESSAALDVVASQTPSSATGVNSRLPISSPVPSSAGGYVRRGARRRAPVPATPSVLPDIEETTL